MSNTIRWLPNQEPDIASYRLENAPASTGPWVTLVTITHDLNDSNVFDGTFFFYDHVTGTSADWYRLISIDTTALESPPSTPFTVSGTGTTPPTETVGLTEDFGGTNVLQPVDTNGAPIENTQVRVFFKTDYDNDDLDSPVGTVLTTSTGAWGAAIFVGPGFTYTVHFEKPGEFGPATVELVIS